MTTATLDAPFSKSRFYAVMAVLLLVEVLSSLEHSMVITALPTAVREFKGIAAAGWLVTIFLLAQAATAAVGGRLGDMFGRRRVLFWVIALCMTGSLISAFGGRLEAIIIGRAIQGASGAILPLCYGLTREIAPKGAAPVWIGILTGGYSFAAAIGYILGGHLADIGSWRAVFYATAGYAAFLLPLLMLVVPATRSSAGSKELDWLGAVLFAPAIAAILFGITQGGDVGWGAVGSWGFVLGGVVAGAFWVWYEAHHQNPLIDVRLLERPQIAVANLCAALASIGMMQLPIVTMLILQQPKLAGVGLAVTATVAGLLKLPSNISSLIAAPLSGWIASKSGARVALFIGALIGAAGWGALLIFHATIMQVVLGAVVCAFAATMLLAAIPNLVLEGAPLERSSEVTGMTAVFRHMASGVGAQLITLLLATSRVTEPATGATFPDDAAYRLTFGYIAVTALMIAGLCLFLKNATVKAKEAPAPAGRRSPAE